MDVVEQILRYAELPLPRIRALLSERGREICGFLGIRRSQLDAQVVHGDLRKESAEYMLSLASRQAEFVRGLMLRQLRTLDFVAGLVSGEGEGIHATEGVGDSDGGSLSQAGASGPVSGANLQSASRLGVSLRSDGGSLPVVFHPGSNTRYVLFRSLQLHPERLGPEFLWDALSQSFLLRHVRRRRFVLPDTCYYVIEGGVERDCYFLLQEKCYSALLPFSVVARALAAEPPELLQNVLLYCLHELLALLALLHGNGLFLNGDFSSLCVDRRTGELRVNGCSFAIPVPESPEAAVCMDLEAAAGFIAFCLDQPAVCDQDVRQSLDYLLLTIRASLFQDDRDTHTVIQNPREVAERLWLHPVFYSNREPCVCLAFVPLPEPLIQDMLDDYAELESEAVSRQDRWVEDVRDWISEFSWGSGEGGKDEIGCQGAPSGTPIRGSGEAQVESPVHVSPPAPDGPLARSHAGFLDSFSLFEEPSRVSAPRRCASAGFSGRRGGYAPFQEFHRVVSAGGRVSYRRNDTPSPVALRRSCDARDSRAAVEVMEAVEAGHSARSARSTESVRSAEGEPAPTPPPIGDDRYAAIEPSISANGGFLLDSAEAGRGPSCGRGTFRSLSPARGAPEFIASLDGLCARIEVGAPLALLPPIPFPAASAAVSVVPLIAQGLEAPDTSLGTSALPGEQARGPAPYTPRRSRRSLSAGGTREEGQGKPEVGREAEHSLSSDVSGRRASARGKGVGAAGAAPSSIRRARSATLGPATARKAVLARSNALPGPVHFRSPFPSASEGAPQKPPLVPSSEYPGAPSRGAFQRPSSALPFSRENSVAQDSLHFNTLRAEASLRALAFGGSGTPAGASTPVGRAASAPKPAFPDVRDASLSSAVDSAVDSAADSASDPPSDPSRPAGADLSFALSSSASMPLLPGVDSAQLHALTGSTGRLIARPPPPQALPLPSPSHPRQPAVHAAGAAPPVPKQPQSGFRRRMRAPVSVCQVTDARDPLNSASGLAADPRGPQPISRGNWPRAVGPHSLPASPYRGTRLAWGSANLREQGGLPVQDDANRPRSRSAHVCAPELRMSAPKASRGLLGVSNRVPEGRARPLSALHRQPAGSPARGSVTSSQLAGYPPRGSSAVPPSPTAEESDGENPLAQLNEELLRAFR